MIMIICINMKINILSRIQEKEENNYLKVNSILNQDVIKFNKIESNLFFHKEYDRNQNEITRYNNKFLFKLKNKILLLFVIINYIYKKINIS